MSATCYWCVLHQIWVLTTLLSSKLLVLQHKVWQLFEVKSVELVNSLMAAHQTILLNNLEGCLVPKRMTFPAFNTMYIYISPICSRWTECDINAVNKLINWFYSSILLAVCVKAIIYEVRMPVCPRRTRIRCTLWVSSLPASRTELCLVKPATQHVPQANIYVCILPARCSGHVFIYEEDMIAKGCGEWYSKKYKAQHYSCWLHQWVNWRALHGPLCL